MAADRDGQDLHSLTTEIVASFVSNNVVAVGDLPAVITSIFEALRSVTETATEQPVEAPIPAVPIRKSIGTNYLICLEDGHKLRMLKRHLARR